MLNKYRLKLNLQKKEIKKYDYQLKQILTFKYLDSSITEQGTVDGEINNHITKYSHNVGLYTDC